MNSILTLLLLVSILFAVSQGGHPKLNVSPDHCYLGEGTGTLIYLGRIIDFNYTYINVCVDSQRQLRNYIATYVRNGIASDVVIFDSKTEDASFQLQSGVCFKTASQADRIGATELHKLVETNNTLNKYEYTEGNSSITVIADEEGIPISFQIIDFETLYGDRFDLEFWVTNFSNFSAPFPVFQLPEECDQAGVTCNACYNSAYITGSNFLLSTLCVVFLEVLVHNLY